ncbi:MAG: efflux RND transporter periplasmic adaptor subunit, partial [Spirochaetia bacterium]
RRNIELMEEGASQEELEMARANADAAQRQYEIASLQVENTRITAPVGGVVAQVMVDEGNTVGLSTGIIAIVQDDPIIARIPIPERYYGDFLLYEGSIDVLISAIAYPHADSFSGTIHQLPAVINAENRTFGVEIAVENESRLLRPGMYVTAEFRMNIIDNARMLPADAVLNRAGGEVVFTLTEGNSFHANMIEVETGIVQGDMVQVLSGVDMDDIVIVEGNSFLEDGQLVRVVE